MSERPVNVNRPSETDMKPESPFHTVPPLIIALALLIVGIEAVFQLANAGIIGGPRGVGWRISAIEQYGYSAAVLDRVWVNGDYSFDMLKRFVTYPFLNAQLTQTIFCAVLTLALGKFTTAYYGSLKVAFLYLMTSIVGAIAFGLFVNDRMPLVGGFTPVYGLIGAYTYALWLKRKADGENQILAFRLIGTLLLIQLIFGLIFGGNNQWISELTGFFAGFALAVVLAPGGWGTLVGRLRERS